MFSTGQWCLHSKFQTDARAKGFAYRETEGVLSSVEWGQGYSSQESWRVYDKGWEDMPVTITLLQVRFHSISIPFQFDFNSV